MLVYRPFWFCLFDAFCEIAKQKYKKYKKNKN